MLFHSWRPVCRGCFSHFQGPSRASAELQWPLRVRGSRGHWGPSGLQSSLSRDAIGSEASLSARRAGGPGTRGGRSLLQTDRSLHGGGTSGPERFHHRDVRSWAPASGFTLPLASQPPGRALPACTGLAPRPHGCSSSALTELTQGRPLPLGICPLTSGMSCGDRSQGASRDLRLPAASWQNSGWPLGRRAAARLLGACPARPPDSGAEDKACAALVGGTRRFPGARWDTLHISHQFRRPKANTASSVARAG